MAAKFIARILRVKLRTEASSPLASFMNQLNMSFWFGSDEYLAAESKS